MRIFFFVLGLIISNVSLAVCPLCTFAVGAGIGLTQYLGIDDIISGIWIGGMLVSLIVLTKRWFERKNIYFRGMTIVVTVFYYGTTIAPLYLSGIIGHDLNKWWGIDRLLFGIISGSIFFMIGVISYDYLKRHNDNRAYFPFQKVVMPLGILIILSVTFCFLCK